VKLRDFKIASYAGILRKHF